MSETARKVFQFFFKNAIVHAPINFDMPRLTFHPGHVICSAGEMGYEYLPVISGAV